MIAFKHEDEKLCLLFRISFCIRVPQRYDYRFPAVISIPVVPNVHLRILLFAINAFLIVKEIIQTHKVSGFTQLPLTTM
ncbi:hypothetical protein EVA_14771 [gut metagenome]|uniref:Uncharacterized protein n=1 Tax=gut metagenome TaxID=749906 RepID=J9FRL6_9ZZZZ